MRCRWTVLRTSSGRPLVKFSLVTSGDSRDVNSGEIIVGKGTIEVKISFADELSPDQREYIANGMMYIK